MDHEDKSVLKTSFDLFPASYLLYPPYIPRIIELILGVVRPRKGRELEIARGTFNGADLPAVLTAETGVSNRNLVRNTSTRWRNMSPEIRVDVEPSLSRVLRYRLRGTCIEISLPEGTFSELVNRARSWAKFLKKTRRRRKVSSHEILHVSVIKTSTTLLSMQEEDFGFVGSFAACEKKYYFRGPN